MKLEDLNKIYTKGFDSLQKKLDVIGEDVYNNKILPKLIKAAKNGESYVTFHFWRYSTYMATCKILTKKNISFEYASAGFWFSQYALRVYGWKYIQSNPNDILKENV